MRLNPEIEKLIIDNTGLVWYVAKKYESNQYELEDLVSEGMIGLIKAANSYDSSKNIKFATYATMCIRNEILMYMRKEKKHVNVLNLESPINTDSEGNSIELGDIIVDPKSDFFEDIESELSVNRIFNIVLNTTKGTDRLIMLYEISGKNQSWIASKFGFSQSYVSRLISKNRMKMKQIYQEDTDFDEVFQVFNEKGFFKIRFWIQGDDESNLLFSNYLMENFSNLNTLKVSCTENQIDILSIAKFEKFSFVADIIEK